MTAISMTHKEPKESLSIAGFDLYVKESGLSQNYVKTIRMSKQKNLSDGYRI